MLRSQGEHHGSKLSQKLEAASMLLSQVETEEDELFWEKSAMRVRHSWSQRCMNVRVKVGRAPREPPAQPHKETATQGPQQMHLLG